MPKLKTHRGTAKRFRVTKGRVKVRSANRAHILTKNPSKLKRQARRGVTLKKCDAKLALRLLQGC